MSPLSNMAKMDGNNVRQIVMVGPIKLDQTKFDVA